MNSITGLARRLLAWKPVLALAGLAGLISFQAYAFYFRMPLAANPRVILEPWLLRQGYLLYDEVVDIHTPLMPLVLAVLAPLIGEDLRMAKLMIVALLTAATLLIFYWGQRKLGWWSGLWAAGFFAVWAPAFFFGKLWHEIFLTPTYLLFLFFFQPNSERHSLRWCVLLGLLGGLSVMIKQHAAVLFAVYLAWELGWAIARQRSLARVLRELVTAGLVSLLPLAGYTIYQWIQAGGVDPFFYWIAGYHTQGVYSELAEQAPTLAQAAALVSCALLLPAALTFVLQLKKNGSREWQHPALWLVLMCAASFTAYPRFEFFHLQPALPFVGLLSAFAIRQALRFEGPARAFAASMVIAVSLFWIASQGNSYVEAFNPGRARPIYEYSNLPPLAAEIRKETGDSRSFYLFGDDEEVSNLYYFLEAAPPRFWIFHYPWYTLDWMQQRMVAALDEDSTEWVIYFPGQWDVEKSAPLVLEYIDEHYQAVKTIEWQGSQVRVLKRVR